MNFLLYYTVFVYCMNQGRKEMKKIIITSVCAILSYNAYATDNIQPMPDMPGKPHANIMSNLTTEQQSCIQAYGCNIQMPPLPTSDGNEAGQRPEPPKEVPSEKPEPNADTECLHKAMESCGIEMPKRPERPDNK